MEEIKVLVVDDSALMRGELRKIIEKDPSLKVIGTAKDGSEVLNKVRRLNPDVVTLDVNMPKMDGIEALKILMEERPLPVLMVSSLTSEGADITIEALSLGAFDFIHKPSGGMSLDLGTQGEQIREKIKTAGRNPNFFKKRRHLKPSPKPVRRVAAPTRRTATPSSGDQPRSFVGIGVSTGGPKTLMQVLPQIPGDFEGAIIIAQHMPEKFTLSFANRLNGNCPLHVKEAEDGEILKKGTIYIAPGGKHLKLVNRNNKLNMFEIVSEVPGRIYKPSVDVLFNSMVDQIGGRWVGVILTGMGNDGAESLLKLRQRGGRTIAEAEESCVVFGMPAKAIENGAAEFVLSLEEIADKIVNLSGNNG